MSAVRPNVGNNSQYKLEGPERERAFNRAPVIPDAGNYTGRVDEQGEEGGRGGGLGN